MLSPAQALGVKRKGIPVCGDQLGLCLLQWFEEKLQEVECEDQRLRKLHAVVEALVTHRKGWYRTLCSLTRTG